MTVSMSVAWFVIIFIQILPGLWLIKIFWDIRKIIKEIDKSMEKLDKAMKEIDVENSELYSLPSSVYHNKWYFKPLVYNKIPFSAS